MIAFEQNNRIRAIKEDNLEEIQMIPEHLTGLNCKMCCVSAGAGKNLLRKYSADEKGLFLLFE